MNINERAISRKKLRNSDKEDLVLHDIAHFLIINSEAVDKNKAPSTKIIILYFFFLYARKYEKQYYADFAFELFQDSLSSAIINLNIGKSESQESLETGCGLLLFLEEGFFISDELDDILKPFDNVAIKETVSLLKEDFMVANMNKLLSIAFYFLYRMDHLDETSQHTIIIRKHLSKVFFKLKRYIKSSHEKEIIHIMSISFLLKKSLPLNKMQCLEEDLWQICNSIMPNKRRILKSFISAEMEGKLTKSFPLSQYFFEKINKIPDGEHLLRKNSEIQIVKNMKQSYNRDKAPPTSIVKRITIQTLALIEQPVPKYLAVYIAITNLNIE